MLLCPFKSLGLSFTACAIQLHSHMRHVVLLQAGALYTVYTIHKTQPAYKGRRVRAYIPVSSLQAISEMLPEARERHIPDIPAVVKCLVSEDAFVLGGVRRPPAGHQIVRDAPVRSASVILSRLHLFGLHFGQGIPVTLRLQLPVSEKPSYIFCSFGQKITVSAVPKV